MSDESKNNNGSSGPQVDGSQRAKDSLKSGERGPPPGGVQQSRSSQPFEQRTVFAGVPLFPTEDRALFAQFRELMLDELDPVGIQQESVAERIIVLRWRLQNLSIFFQAQNARKQYGQLIRGTLGETALAFAEFWQKRFELSMKNLVIRSKMSPEEKWDLIRESADPPGSEMPKEMSEYLKKAGGSVDEDPMKIMMSFQENMMKFLKPEQVKKVDEEMTNGFPLELAFFAHLVTPENYLAELKVATEIERAIDRNLNLLQKLKEQKRKESEAFDRRSRIFP